MNLNKTELRIILFDFNSIANRLLKADMEDYGGVLNKFLRFLSDTEIIKAYLDDCGNPTIPDIESEFMEVAKSYGDSIFSTGETEAEENANIHAILSYLSNNIRYIRGIIMGYSHSNKYSDKLKGFNERFTLILIQNIEGYLRKLGIKMGLDDSTRYNITVHNGQVNLANDNSTINAVMNNGVDQFRLNELLNNLVAKSQIELPVEEQEIVSDSVEVIRQELQNEKPKKSLLRGVMSTLNGIKNSAEFLAALATLAQFLQPILGY